MFDKVLAMIAQFFCPAVAPQSLGCGDFLDLEHGVTYVGPGVSGSHAVARGTNASGQCEF